MKKEMNLILNNLRNLRDSIIGQDLLQDTMLDTLIDTELDQIIEETKDKVAAQHIKSILAKCRELKKLYNFSKAQILYEKNLKIIRSATESQAIDSISIMPSGKFLKN